MLLPEKLPDIQTLNLVEQPPHIKSLRERFADAILPRYDGPTTWLLFSAIGRLGVLWVIALGAQRTSQFLNEGIIPFIIVFAAAFLCSTWYLYKVYRQEQVSATLTWAQVLLDFCVVAFTISLTGGGLSYFSFLLVIVVLEAGILLGIFQGFAFALLALFYLFITDLPIAFNESNLFPYWYTFLIQWIVMISTAIVSGYWNQRISRLKQFQGDILDNMVSGFLICNPQGTILLANRTALQILQMSEDQLLGRSITKLLVTQEDGECPIQVALNDELGYVNYEFLWNSPSNTPKILGLTTNRLYNARGKFKNLIIVLQDLTEIVKLRTELQQQDRLAAVGESATELAHEIRNPLAALRSAVDELVRNINSPELAIRLCNIALRESEHLNRIVSRFLEFARSAPPCFTPLVLERILKEACDAISQAYPDVTIKLQMPNPSPVISGDATQLRQVWDNILQNSVESMNNKGEISVTVSCQGKYVEIRLEDTGIGVSEENLLRIFEPFYTEKEKGIGMGLTISMRIIMAHKGDIRASIRPGGGLVMLVRLPVQQE